MLKKSFKWSFYFYEILCDPCCLSILKLNTKDTKVSTKALKGLFIYPVNQVDFLSDFSAFFPLTLKGESRKINLYPLGSEVNQVDFSMFFESVKGELISLHKLKN